MPAPGQFINDTAPNGAGFDGTQTTHEEAIAYAEARLSKNSFVSLGGFGGYIVVGFDHDVANAPSDDFAIKGNPNATSSEPGVVWVMQDENANCLPDDTWYELAASETGQPQTIENYSVTYYRPTSPKMSVRWSDNRGNSGEINYIESQHSQDTYYPLWVESDSYTLSGTCLEARNELSADGANWTLSPYGWGYADNFSSVDYFAGNRDNENRFDISNAIDADGKSVRLEHINFVKVQCAVNAQSGHLGEVSTEVCGFRDLTIY
jgi:hypothetical protein